MEEKITAREARTDAAAERGIRTEVSQAR